MRYSKRVALQESSAGRPCTVVTARPRWNQWRSGTSPLAMATKLARRASEASRSYQAGSSRPGPSASAAR